MGRFLGSGFGRFGDGQSLIGLMIQPPWFSYFVLFCLVMCYLFFLAEHKRWISVVQGMILVCIALVFVCRDTPEHGLEYACIWVGGLIGVGAYWTERLIRESDDPPSTV